MLLVHPGWLLLSCTTSTPNVHLLGQSVLRTRFSVATTRHKSSNPPSNCSSDTLLTGYKMGKKTKITRGSGGNTRGEGSGGKPTHFLCLPIASDSTIHQISASLSHWMDVTTRPVSKAPHRRPVIHNKLSGLPEVIGEFDREVEDEANRDEVTPNTDRPTKETLEESLKILPPIVTRAAGTWHLTLGVMNLADEGRMKLALEVLKGLDLQRLLDEAGKGPPAGYKPARKWEHRKQDDEVAMIGDHDDNDTVNVESNTQPSNATTQLHRSPRLTISLTGLGAFPSLNNARVLWARPREQPSPGLNAHPDSTNIPAPTPALANSPRLYNFAFHLIQPFRAAGLITETRGLALHATVANMRFMKISRRKAPWQSDRVDAGRIARVWNEHKGEVEGRTSKEAERDTGGQEDDDDDVGQGDEPGGGSEKGDPTKEFVWVKDVNVDRVAICKLGATRHGDPLWREWYPPIEGGERFIFE